MAASFWERHPGLFKRTLEAVRSWPGIDAGWKEALIAGAPPVTGRKGPYSRMELLIDAEPETALSLAAFRRRPWPARWPLVQVRQDMLAGLRVPPAFSWRGTTPNAVEAGPCRRSSGGHLLLTP
jgi:hypothetical protein